MDAAEKIMALAEALDLGGKPNARILVRSTRQYLMRCGIKPEKRGEPLTVGQHRIEFVEQVLPE